MAGFARLGASVFPARAGMIRSRGPHAASVGSIPRESGDDPGRGELAVAAGTYSPRERG